MEDLGDAYLLPVVVPNKKKTTLAVVEQTPVVQSLTIWHQDAFVALELYLKNTKDLSKASREKLTSLLEKRRRIAIIDTKVQHLTLKRQELDERMRQTRENLVALKKNKAAGPLKARLADKLEAYAEEADLASREIVALTDERLELKVAVDEMTADLTLSE
jgi:hypothetical protein